MNDLQELRIWVELELKEARNNIRLSQSSPEGFYYLHNKGRESTLRKVLDKIDVLLSARVPITRPPQQKRIS